MRVTNQMMSNRLLTNINRNLGLLDKYNTQGTTGKKIQVPSDDPIIASRALKFRTMLSETEQYSKNASQSSSWVDATEAVFNNVDKILIDLRGLATQAANDTLTTDDRKKILVEYRSLLEQLEQEFNTDYMGRSIFSGFRTDKKPIIKDQNGNNILNPEVYGDPNANPPIVSVAGQKIEIQIGSGITTDINTIITDLYSQDDFNNLRGGVSLNPPVTPPGAYPQPNYTGATEFDRIFNFINSPQYENMTADEKLAWEKDPANDIRGKMAEMIKTIEDYSSKVSVQNTEVGVRSKRIELVEVRLRDDGDNYKKVMSDNEDIDLAEVMMNFNTANAAYIASLNIGMKVNQMTLADYLR